MLRDWFCHFRNMQFHLERVFTLILTPYMIGTRNFGIIKKVLERRVSPPSRFNLVAVYFIIWNVPSGFSPNFRSIAISNQVTN